MSRPKSAPRQLSQARAAETRARILQAARNAFAEHGFAGANIREIAREAGTTHSQVTYHFGSKDQLWREAVRDMFRLIDREVFAPMAEEAKLPARERLGRLTRRYARYCAHHPEHARITMAETIRGGERLYWMVNEFVRANHATALPWMRELMDEGAIPRMSEESFLYSYVGLLQLPFVLAKEAALMGYDFESEAAIDRHAQVVLDLILKG